MSKNKGIFSQLQVEEIYSLIADYIAVGNKLQYSSSPDIDNDNDIPNKAYVDSQAVSVELIEKNQSHIAGSDPYYLEVSEIATANIWNCSYTTEVEDPLNPGQFLYETFYLTNNAFQNGKIFGFPDPATNTYSIRIPYI